MKNRIVLSLFCALFLSPPLVGELDSSTWSEVRKSFQKRYRSRAVNERLAAVQALSGKDDRRVAGLVFAVLGNRKEVDKVKAAAIEVLGTFREEKTISEVLKRWKRIRETDLRGRILRVLAANIGGPKLEDLLLTSIRSRDPVSRIVAVDALGVMKSERGFDAVVKALKDPVSAVRLSAVSALVSYRNERAVDALLDGFEKAPAGGRLEDEYGRALQALTGKNLGSSWAQWRSWWNVNRGKPLAGSGEMSPPPTAESAGGGPADESITFFGIKLKSRRVIFVVDLSGSMDLKLARKEEMKRKLQVVISGGDGEKAAPAKEQLDWGKIDKKVDLAKAELIRAIESLRGDASFNIVWYNTSVGVWKKEGLIQASPQAKKDAANWINGRKPEGETDIRGALKKAIFLQSSKDGQEEGPGVVTTGDLEEGGDTIVFLTDGWGYKNGKDQDPNETLEKIKEWNKIPKMRIYTVGISDKPGEHDRKLLEALADQHGGEYRAP